MLIFGYRQSDMIAYILYLTYCFCTGYYFILIRNDYACLSATITHATKCAPRCYLQATLLLVHMLTPYDQDGLLVTTQRRYGWWWYSSWWIIFFTLLGNLRPKRQLLNAEVWSVMIWYLSRSTCGWKKTLYYSSFFRYNE